MILLFAKNIILLIRNCLYEILTAIFSGYLRITNPKLLPGLTDFQSGCYITFQNQTIALSMKQIKIPRTMTSLVWVINSSFLSLPHIYAQKMLIYLYNIKKLAI